ncbi:AraC family transcriptional regulator [Solirubrobacter phytolaccae]|uniref:AraC family transcriptional regulator n=1 Tax=Solirubrobacter phytolaccae TaxID=1404360 RepID=A0A9X3NKD2_9ACTN|nr:AraC family transcriptional regulator [Solirubrobacter phytolaccae]MDA0185171.1 AraC family transcriptional regulator [Solirubrobacter phytolaccae]
MSAHAVIRDPGVVRSNGLKGFVLLPASHRSSTVTARREIWRAATDYIELHLATSLNVDDVARAAITSRRQLQRVFASEGGTTVREYITVARMRQATVLVLQSDEPLAQIAPAVGYGHVSAFIKAFRLHHGTTPIELRRRHRDIATAPRRASHDWRTAFRGEGAGDELRGAV